MTEPQKIRILFEKRGYEGNYVLGLYTTEPEARAALREMLGPDDWRDDWDSEDFWNGESEYFLGWSYLNAKASR
jgi:hypothetical protein